MAERYQLSRSAPETGDLNPTSIAAAAGAMQTIQALWTQARENLDVTTVIFSNRKYAILQVEFSRVGVFNPGAKAMSVTSLDNPNLDFLQLSRGMGVQADCATTADEFNSLFESAMKNRGPRLIEAIL